MNLLIAPDNAWPIWAFIIVGTAVCIFCEQNYKWAAKISGPVLSLLIGMFLSNFKIMPTDSFLRSRGGLSGGGGDSAAVVSRGRRAHLA
jgi:uncharacterized membrane protein